MVVITVELWPQGDPESKRCLGVAHISNDGTGKEASGSYDVTLFTWGEMPKVWKKGRVEGFDRKKRGPWDLLLLALLDAVGDRIKKITSEDQ
jgi:hypothetical protein